MAMIVKQWQSPDSGTSSPINILDNCYRLFTFRLKKEEIQKKLEIT